MRHFLLAALFAVTSARAIPYTFTDLGDGSFAAAINDAGQVAGSRSGDAALWSGNTMTDLGTGEARGINNAGQVVGNSNGQATIWNGTTPTYIGHFLATAINDPGQVVGQNFDAPGVGTNAILWDGTSAAFIEPAGTALMHPLAMNDAGDIAGWGRTIGTGVDQARLLIDGIGIRLASLPDASFADGAGYDISNSGQIVGFTYAAHTDERAVSWNAGTHDPTNLGTLGGGGRSQAFAINESGDIVGYSTINGFSDARAVIWQDGAIIDLNSFLDASTIAAGWKLTRANDINESGWIVGDAFNSLTGQTHGFVLAPSVPAVPEPEIYAMLAAGLGVLGWRTRRRRQ